MNGRDDTKHTPDEQRALEVDVKIADFIQEQASAIRRFK